MKKQILLLGLLATMLLPLATRAQNDSLMQSPVGHVVGDASESYTYAPIHFGQKLSYAQILYRSSELISGDITEINFLFSTVSGSSNYYTRDNVKVFLAVTNDNSFQPDSTGNRWKSPLWTQVFSGTVSRVEGDCRITLDSPFHYTRSMGNLLVAIYDSSNVTSTSGSMPTFYHSHTADILQIFSYSNVENLTNDNCLGHTSYVARFGNDYGRSSVRFTIHPCRSLTEVQDTIMTGETYAFGGRRLSATGTYRDTIVGSLSNGCDSIVYLYLTCLGTPCPNQVAVNATPTEGGTVEGTGLYCQGEPATLTAMPAEGYCFQHWADGNHLNPLTLTAQEDTVLQATFAPIITLRDTLLQHDTAYIPVHDTLYLTLHDTIYLPVYETIHDTLRLTEQVHDTLYITSHTHDTIYLPQYLHDTLYITQQVHDTLYLTTHDTIYLPQYIHDTIYITQEGTPLVESPSLTLYPNPCTDHLYVETDFSSAQSIEVYDLQGRVVLRQESPSAQCSTLNVSALPAGTYLLRVDNYVRRFVKQ